MATTVEELTIHYEDDNGVVLTKELSKVILSKGAWVTVMYQFCSWNNTKLEYSEPKFQITRYQKRNGLYVFKSKFNISSNKQAKLICDTLQDWIAE